jgi:hypothetical protein
MSILGTLSGGCVINKSMCFSSKYEASPCFLFDKLHIAYFLIKYNILISQRYQLYLASVPTKTSMMHKKRKRKRPCHGN